MNVEQTNLNLRLCIPHHILHNRIFMKIMFHRFRQLVFPNFFFFFCSFSLQKKTQEEKDTKSKERMNYIRRQYNWYKLEFGLTLLSGWEVAIISMYIVIYPWRRFVRLFANIYIYIFFFYVDIFVVLVLSTIAYYTSQTLMTLLGSIK